MNIRKAISICLLALLIFALKSENGFAVGLDKLPISKTPTGGYSMFLPAVSKNSLFITAAFEADGNLYLNGEMILNVFVEAPGCFGGGGVLYSPTNEYFLAILACFEGDNDAFLFRYDGTDKRKITGQWDYVNYFYIYWDPDGASFVYWRINSCCANPPPDAPPQGWVRYDIPTGTKTLLP